MKIEHRALEVVKGDIIGASKNSSDITEQKKDEQLIPLGEQKFLLLAEALSQLIMTINDKSDVCYVNQSFIDYTGRQSEELLYESWLKHIHINDLERTTSMWEVSLNNGNEFLGEQRLLRHDGKYEWHLTRIIPQENQDGKIQLWIATSTNIHENKIFTEKLENQVQQRTDELKLLNDDLQKSNIELAEFAFVASHDLQEPLRKIQTFANRIVQKEESNLSVNGKRYLKRMQNSTLRMQSLIEDLLKYSRASTAEKVFEPVDLNNLLNEVKAELDQRISEKHAKVNVNQICVLNIIRFQFLQLFMNLISNSLKFSKPGINPEINITSAKLNGREINDKRAVLNFTYCNITVEDNGIGFPSEQSEKIFELFYRLHGKSEFSGTGIGLSICKKIVENHHGFITANSNPSSGSIFNIYIPVELDVA